MTIGSAREARGWIDGSALAAADRLALHGLVDRFPTLTFCRDDPALLDDLERRNEVGLPRWLRAIRQTLAGPGPDVAIRFDDFDHVGPHSDKVADDGFLELRFTDHFFGYVQAEQRELFLDGAGCYPILSATTGVQYVLAVSLLAPDDERIVEFCDEDIMDNVYEGTAGTDSVDIAFDSYPRMLSHIVECHLPDGTVVRSAHL
jgi:hypothetical protein